MSIIIDRKYISQISSRLDRFAQKKDSLYNFRCPLCGDSKKNLNKARGFLYVGKRGFNYKCHNCGIGHTFGTFLKQIDDILFRKYSKLDDVLNLREVKFMRKINHPNIIKMKEIIT